MIEGIDTSLPSWRHLKKHLEERIAYHHALIENVNLSDRDTAIMRGRIAEIRELIYRAEHRPGFEPEDEGLEPNAGDPYADA